MAPETSFRMLHFSDTHNNFRATTAMLQVAARYPAVHVAITGDVCTYRNKVADPRLNTLTTGRTWLVPGEHDMPVEACLAHLTGVRWNTPFFDAEGTVLVIAVTTRNYGVIADRLSLDALPLSLNHLSAGIVLGHHRIIDTELEELVSMLPPSWSGVPWVLCDGHEHGDSTLFARSYEHVVRATHWRVSHVYSANRRRLGAANLIEVSPTGHVTVRELDASTAD